MKRLKAGPPLGGAPPYARWSRCLVGLGAVVGTGTALAFQFDTDVPELRINWDNTVKYSNGFRLKDRSAALVANPALDDGDRNFGKGLISNRFDLFSELDIKYRNFGARVSGAAWYDTVYNARNDNDSFGRFGPGSNSVNQSGASYNEFTASARKLHGRDGEILDAFVFGNFDIDDRRASLRLGQHTVLYGESLFFGANGIARAQAPVDVIKALSVPNTQFKELIRPVPQISGSLQLSETVSIGAYYQFHWEADRIPAAGSYYAFADNVGAGGARLLPSGALPPGFDTARRADQEPKNSGQGGVQLRKRWGETDFGFYAVRFHSKNFDQYTYLQPTAGAPIPVGYQLTYGEGIKAYGMSASRSFGDVNLATEVSVRRNTPLLSQVALFPGQSGDNGDNPQYAVGNSAHAQASVIWQLPRTPLFNEGTMAGEVAWNRATSVTKNAAAIDPNTTRDAWGLRAVVTPVYRQVLSGIDLEVPIGIGYNVKGASRVVPQFNAPASDGGGDFSIGLNFAYLDAWRFGISYTHFFGSSGAFLDAAGNRSFRQVYADRDVVSMTARITF